MLDRPYHAYDGFAEIYNRHWERFSVDSRPALQHLLYPVLPAGSHVLDLGCGTGQVSARLVERGFRVTGLDGSEAMLRFARENAPDADFLWGDARGFRLDAPVDAVVAFSEVPNHLLSLSEVQSMFACVAQALRPGGCFLFDVNPETKYLDHWTDSFGLVGDDHACIVRASYDLAQQSARFDATLFLLREHWERSDLVIYEQCYSDDELRGALATAGFVDVATYDLRRDLDSHGEPAKAFWFCRVPVISGIA